jgi:hypothetical protein
MQLGLTPLHIAVTDQQLDVVSCLLELGASPFTTTKTGENVRRCVCACGRARAHTHWTCHVYPHCMTALSPVPMHQRLGLVHTLPDNA